MRAPEADAVATHTSMAGAHPDGQKYVLASDRDHGLYIFQYTGKP